MRRCKHPFHHLLRSVPRVIDPFSVTLNSCARNGQHNVAVAAVVAMAKECVYVVEELGVSYLTKVNRLL